MIECPQADILHRIGYTLAASVLTQDAGFIAETQRLFPNKRIKFVVNTHPHFDHLSGLPPFVAEGITILTDDNSKYFVEQALASPRTLLGDTLAQSRKKPKVEG